MSSVLSRILRVALSVLPFASLTGGAMAAPRMPSPATAWTAARAIDNAESYARFILENPESPHVAEAQARLGVLGAVHEALGAAAPQGIDRPMAQDGWSGSPAARLLNI